MNLMFLLAKNSLKIHKDITILAKKKKKCLETNLFGST